MALIDRVNDPELANQTYTIQLGHRNLLWNEARDREQVISYELPKIDGLVKAGDEAGIRKLLNERERLLSDSSHFSGEDAGKSWLSIWRNRYDLFRSPGRC